MIRATPFLLFPHGQGRAGLDFNVETVPGSRTGSLEPFGPQGPGPEGTILRAHTVVAGQPVMAHDSVLDHRLDFTPSRWLLMSPNSWSTGFGRLSDEFGVSCQVNLA